MNLRKFTADEFSQLHNVLMDMCRFLAGRNSLIRQIHRLKIRELFHVQSQATAEVGSMQIKLRKGLKMIRQLMADMAI